MFIEISRNILVVQEPTNGSGLQNLLKIHLVIKIFLILDENGRNMIGFKNCEVYGIDNCQEFINICKSKNINNVFLSDMTQTPFPNDYFHYMMSIASFHHLSTEERRLQALREYVEYLTITRN